MKQSLLLSILLVATGLLAVPQAPAAEEWGFGDARGDVEVGHFLSPTAPVPGTVVTDEADIVSFGLESEDETDLNLVLGFADLNARNVEQEYPAWSALITFKPVGGTLQFAATSTFFPLAGVPALSTARPAIAGMRLCAQGKELHCTDFGTVTVDYAASKMRFRFSKSVLAGVGPIGERWTPDLDPTTPPGGLHDWTVEVNRREGAFVLAEVVMKDRVVPPEDKPLLFRAPFANTKLHLSHPVVKLDPNLVRTPFTNGPVDASVPAGGAATIGLRLTNSMPAKRIVNLSVSPDSAAPGWNISLPPLVEVPARSSRNLTLRVEVKADVAQRTRHNVTVIGRSLGFADELVADKVALAVTGSLSPEQPKLHFHAGALRYDAYLIPCRETPVCQSQWLWMNGQETDPAADMDATGYSRAPSMDGPQTFRVSFVGAQDVPGSANLFPIPNAPVHATLVLQSPAAFQAKAKLVVSLSPPEFTCYNSGCSVSPEPIAELMKTLPVTVGENTFELDVPQIGPKVWQAGGRVVAVRFALETEDATILQASKDGLLLATAKSSLVLPLQAPPQDASAASHLRFYVDADGSSDFVNPSKSRLLRARLANEGADADRIQFTANVSRAGWSARILPGERFDLQGGENANVAILVKAAADGKEGEMTNVTLDAVSELDAAARASTRFQVILTRADLADDSDAYRPDDEALGRVVKEAPHKSPAAAVPFVLLALAWLAAARRPQRR